MVLEGRAWRSSGGCSTGATTEEIPDFLHRY
jgi:hypothetical protein